MRIFFITLISLTGLLLTACNPGGGQQAQEPETLEWAIAIHGGAGVITRDQMTDEMDAAYRSKLEEALAAGKAVLKEGGTASDAVETTIHIMEQSPLFNAGKGAVFTHDGTNELDASFMEGKTLNAGAVAGVTDIKSPITAARKVMTDSRHVMLSGKGASQFAREIGLEIVEPEYFYTERRYKQLKSALEKDKHGTVGCVALDREGNLAAGTSTGGMTNKKYNRIGDAPIIGAGTYANNNSCAVSATGHGEFFIRWTVAHDVSALMEYAGMSLQEAADKVVMDKLVAAGGSGGIISVDKYGRVAMPFNSEGMFRGFAQSSGKEGIFIYKDE